MTVVKQIDIRGMFERRIGRKLPDPKPINAFTIDKRPPIAGNLNTK